MNHAVRGSLGELMRGQEPGWEGTELSKLWCPRGPQCDGTGAGSVTTSLSGISGAESHPTPDTVVG